MNDPYPTINREIQISKVRANILAISLLFAMRLCCLVGQIDAKVSKINLLQQ